MSENIIAQSMNAGNSPELAIRQTSVVRHRQNNLTSMGGDAIRSVLSDMYRERQEQRAKERQQDTVNQQLKGQIQARSGSALPEDAGKLQRDAYEATKYFMDMGDVFNTISQSTQGEEFTSLPKEDRDEFLQNATEDLLLVAQERGLENNTAVLEFINTRINNLYADADANVNNYLTETLPSRTISNLFEVQRTSVEDPTGSTPDDVNGWKEIIDGAIQVADQQGMSPTSRDKHLYGEVSRMLDSGDLSAYLAVQEHKVWDNFTTQQKNVLENGARQVQAGQRKNLLNSFASDFKRLGAQAVASGDMTAMQEQLKSLEQLPATDLDVIMPSIRSTYKKVQDTLEVVELGDARKNGYTYVDMSPEQTRTYAQIQLRKRKARMGNSETTQQAAQSENLDLIKDGIYTDEFSRFYSIENPVFVEGQLDVKTATALSGIEALEANDVSPRIIEDTVGSKSWELYKHYKDFRGKNMDMTSAMSAAVEHYNTSMEAPDSEKFQESLDFVTDLNFVDRMSMLGRFIAEDMPVTSRFFQGVIDDAKNLATVGRAAAIGLPEAESGSRVDALGEALKGNRRRTEFSRAVDATDRTEAAIDPGFLARRFTNIVQDANVTNNQMELMRLMNDIDNRSNTLTKEQKMEIAKAELRDSVVVNGAIVADRSLNKRLLEVAGSKDKASQYATEAAQIMAMMSAFDPGSQTEIISSLYDHYVPNAQGDMVLVDASTEEGLNILVNTPEDDIESTLNFRRLQEYTTNAFTVGGKEYPPLQDALTKIAGRHDAGGGLFGGSLLRRAPATRARYLPESKTFMLEVLDEEGEPLTTDSDLYYTDTQGGELRRSSVNMDDSVALPKGSQLRNTMPVSFLEDYIKANRVSSFSN